MAGKVGHIDGTIDYDPAFGVELPCRGGVLDGFSELALPRLQMRPTISLLADPNGHPYPTPFEMDLTQNLTTQITKVLREEEVIYLSRSFKGI